MKQDNINYLMVGSFVLATMLFLFIVVIKMTGGNGETDNYQVVYRNITGIQSGSAVTYGGYQIGQVDSVQPVSVDNSVRFKLMLAINSDWKIPVDSIARINTPGLLSDPRIDIIEGSSSERLVPGTSIKGQEAANMFETIDTVALEVKDLSEKSIRPLLKNLGLRIDDISREFSEVGGGLTDGIPEVVSNVNRLLNTVNSSADKLDVLLSSNNTRHVSTMLANFDETSKSLLLLSTGLNSSAKRLDQLLANAGQLVETSGDDVNASAKQLYETLSVISSSIDAIVHNINATSRNFNEFSHQIRLNPGLLLGSDPLKDEAEKPR